MRGAALEETSTTPDPPPSAGEFTIFQRVYGIPLVAAAIDKLHEAFSTNVFTARPYSIAQSLAVVVYQCWQPVLRPLAPLIARVDVLANTIFDLAETRLPYLFYATPEDMMGVVHNTRATSFDDARTRLDEGIKRPALHVAEEIDERLAPFLDYYEDHLEPLGLKPAGSTHANDHTELEQTQYQYQRALSLANAVIERITSLPSDQWQQTSFLLQRSVIQVQELSDAMLAQLYALQRTISYLATSMQRSVTAAQKQLTITLVEAANALSATITELQTTLASEDLTTGERIDRVVDLTTSRISPLLERVRVGVGAAMQGKTSPVRNANTTPGRTARTSSNRAADTTSSRTAKTSPARSAKTAPESISRSTSARTAKRANGLKKRSST